MLPLPRVSLLEGGDAEDVGVVGERAGEEGDERVLSGEEEEAVFGSGAFGE